MFNFFNFRTLMFTSVCVASAYFLPGSFHEAFTLLADSSTDEQDLTGFSDPITDLFFEDANALADFYLQELRSYDFDTEHPDLVTAAEAAELVRDNLRTAGDLLSQLHSSNRLPTYQETAATVPFNSVNSEWIRSINNAGDYLRVDEYPSHLQDFARVTRRKIIENLVQQYGYSPDSFDQLDSILIKNPFKNNTIQCLIKNPQVGGSQVPAYGLVNLALK